MGFRDDLHAAYRSTSYHVDGPRGRFVIRVGEPCPDLDGLLHGAGAHTWAFITAHNPCSRRLDDEENCRRHVDLEAAVLAMGLRYHPGEGVGEEGDWPAERSLLVLGIDEQQAAVLARQFGQAAIVCGATGEAARLVWV